MQCGAAHSSIVMLGQGGSDARGFDARGHEQEHMVARRGGARGRRPRVPNWFLCEFWYVIMLCCSASSDMLCTIPSCTRGAISVPYN